MSHYTVYRRHTHTLHTAHSIQNAHKRDMNKKTVFIRLEVETGQGTHTHSECVHDDAIALNKHLLVGLSLFAFIVYGFVSPNVLIIIIFYSIKISLISD